MGKPFMGIEFGVDYNNKIIKVKVPKESYDHFAYRPDMNMVGCFDEFNTIVWAAPIDRIVYVKNMEKGVQK